MTELTELLNANSAVFGRRAAVVAASGGLLTAAVLPAAGQAGDDNVAVSAESQTTEVAEFQNQAATVVAKGNTDDKDKKAEGSSFSADVQTVTAKPAPKPEPKPEPKPASSASSSSSDSSSSDKKSSSKSDSGKDDSKDSGSDFKMPDGSKAQQVLAIAKQYVGTPYVSGGTSPSGWDCSGYTSYVYGKVGVNLPRTSGAQGSAGKTVSKSEAQPGDLIWKPGHIGIYAGNGMMYDAGNPRVDTSYRSIDWMIDGGAKFIRVL
nr:C40 family peptidase [Brevibacterium sp. XM4083]